MAQQWFRRVDGKTVGPLTSKQLKEMASRGEIRPDELISSDTDPSGIPAAKIQGLTFRAAGEPVPPTASSSSNPPERPESTSSEIPNGGVSHFSTGSSTVITESPPASASAPRSKVGWIVAGGVGGVVLLCAIGIAAMMFLTPRPEPPAVNPLAELQSERDQLQQKIEVLKQETKTEEAKEVQAQKEKDALERQRNEIRKEIQDATAQTEVPRHRHAVEQVVLSTRPQRLPLIGTKGSKRTLRTMGFGGLVMGLLAKDPPAAPTAPVVVTMSDVAAERIELRKEIKRLKEEADEWESKRNKSQRGTARLEQDKEKLQLEIQSLEEKRVVLDRWKGVDLVLMNSRQQAVGLKKQGKSFQVWDKQDGELAELVLSVTRNLHVARTVGHALLARDIYNTVEVGQTLPPELEKRVADSVWKTHAFVQVRPDTSTSEIDLAVFRDVVTNEVRIGFLHGATTEGIKIEARGASRELIPWSKIQPGSARHGTPDTVLPMLADVDFLEYSLLRIAQKLGTGDAVGVEPRLIVHSDIEISREHLDHYQRLNDQLAEQARPPSYEHAEGVGVFFSFLGSLHRTSLIGRQNALWKEMNETDPHQRARRMAQFLEGEVQSRLQQWGIPTVSDKDLAKFASGTTPISQAVRAATLHDATHLLYLNVKESRDTGEYHLTVKLFDETGKDSWTTEGDRSLSPEPQLEKFHSSSGDLVVLTLLEKEPPYTTDTPKGSLEDARRMVAPENNPNVVTVGRPRGAKEQRTELVYVEGTVGAKTRIRTLFDDNVKEIATGVIDPKLTKPVANPLNDVPQDLIYRYVVAKFAQQLLAPLGRVEGVTGLTGQVTGLGTAQGIVPGQRCRVLRSVDGQQSMSILPTEAELSDVGNNTSRVSFDRSGFEDFHPENVLMRPGDRLIPRDWKPKSVQVETLNLEMPDKSVGGNLKFNTAGTLGPFESATEKAARTISKRMADGLSRCGISVAAPDYGHPSTIPSTHRVHGTITLSPDMANPSKYNPSSKPVFRINIMVSEIGATGNILLVKFDMTENSL